MSRTRAHANFVCIFLFFYGNGEHRALHSFPTRRSSDLIGFGSSGKRFFFISQPRTTTLRRCSSSSRSEEHTSELQSHSELVCRLLLEKKKSTDQAAEQGISGGQ